MNSIPTSLELLKNSCSHIDNALTKDLKLAHKSSESILTNPPDSYFGDRQIIYKKRTITLPDALFEQYDSLQCKCFMGLFPEINRAWITIDHRLFLWNFEDGSDFYVFEGQEQVIVSVGLVKPIPGVFVDGIEYIILLATPIEIIFLGVAFDEPHNPRSELTLYLTHMSIPSDNVSMTSIVGTSNGRIFMCGNNGHVYELQYQAADGWFTRKCRKINRSSNAYTNLIPTFLKLNQDERVISIAVDEIRHLLYTLTNKSNIEVIYLGENMNDFQRLFKLTDLCRQTSDISSEFVDPKNFQIISIHTILPLESKILNLVAVTSTGLRLYFSGSSPVQSYMPFRNRVNAPPENFRLIHVRPPPIINQEQSNGYYPRISNPQMAIHIADYSGGVFLASNAVSEEMDVLIGMAPYMPSVIHEQGFSELVSTIPIEGKTWAIAEVPNSFTAKLLDNKNNDDVDLICNELVSQHFFPVRHFLVLTNSGVTVLAQQRPIDYLNSLLENYDEDPNSIRSFFDFYTPEQACAMCLAITCGHPYATNSTPGLPSYLSITPSMPVIDAAKRCFFEFGGYPTFTGRPFRNDVVSDVGRPLTIPEPVFSGKHNGLVLYLTRLLRSIWKQNITKKINKGNKKKQEISFTDQDLLTVQKNLSALNQFFVQNPQFSSLPHPTDETLRAASFQEKLEADAFQAEKQSLYALHQLLENCIQAISFLLLLFDYDFSGIIQNLPEQTQNELSELTFESLVCTPKGRAIARNIVAELINKQIDEHIGIDVLSDLLQQNCPSFCTADDVIFYRAVEYLQKAKNTQNLLEREKLLNESLKFFTKVANQIDQEKLTSIVESFKSVNYYHGIIELALICAQEWDPSDLAKSCYDENVPENDYRIDILKKRKYCYALAFNGLEAANIAAANASINKQPGSAVTEAILRSQSKAKEKILASQDILFHYHIYQWLIEQGSIDQLLEFNTPFLEEFLLKNPTPDLEKANLLWRYYVRNKQLLKAANTLEQLAETDEFDIDLQQRLEYLSLAVTHAKGYATNNKDSSIFLLDLEEKLEVAQVQSVIYRKIQSIPEENKELIQHCLQELNSKLMDISQLYNQYAHPLGLHEEELLIFYTSGYKDPQLIESTWNDIINNTYKSDIEADVHQKFDIIANIIIRLGKKFYPNEDVFPLYVLCNMLENLEYQEMNVIERGWVINIMREVGVTYLALFEVFNEIYEKRNSPWHSEVGVNFLIENICILVKEWLKNENRIDIPIKLIDEALTKYIMQCSNSTVEEELKSIQKHIRDFY